MSARHTPGPWRLWNRSGVVAVYAGEKPVVGWMGFDSADVGPRAVGVANAKLIAAAPSLADALEELLRLGERFGPAASERARAALRAAGRPGGGEK